MSAEMTEWLNLALRWIHLVAGILWIGHLYFFNFVNAQLATKYDADSKKKVVPELMPRALYWFRWGALWTWTTGILMLGLVIHMGHMLVDPEAGQSVGLAAGVGFGVVLFGFFAYDLLWKSPLGKNQPAAVAVSFVLLVAVVHLFTRIMTGRSVWIHVGSLFGTIMVMNVWMRIWPAQKKILRGIVGTQAAPDPAVAATAGLRSKHNTYLSVPLMLTMISGHFPSVFGSSYSGGILLVAVLLAWGATFLLYKKSAAASPAAF